MSPPMSSSNDDAPTGKVTSDVSAVPAAPAAPSKTLPYSSTPPPTCESTPTRPTNNYANTHTPIMSAKRPRRRVSGAQRLNPPGSSTRAPSSAPAAAATPMRSPSRTLNDTAAESEESYLSPMHAAKAVPRDSHLAHASSLRGSLSLPAVGFSDSHDSDLSDDDGDEGSPSNHSSASWVGRKVDALFSPVLSFLHSASSVSSSNNNSETFGVNTNSTFLSPVKQKESTLSHEIGACNSDDSEDKAVAVTNAIRDALREAAREVEEDEAASGAIVKTASSESFDKIPGMSITESSGDGNYTAEESPRKRDIDSDGDVAMVDCSNVESENSYDTSTDVRLYENGDYYADENEKEYTTADSNTSRDDSDDEEEEFNPYLFIKSLPPYKYATPPGWDARPKILPPVDPSSNPPVPPICLVLDLDETLVHCTVEPVPDADMIFPVEFNGIEYRVHVRCRPYLTQFLEAVHKRFEVVVFTASQQVYADKLLDKIDPEGKYIRHRMFRDSCLPVEGNFLKDLTVLGRDLSKAVLVDNSPHAFGYQVDNGIPIESWFDDPHDTELLKLERFLRTLHGVEDVRDVVRAKFQTHRLVMDA